MNEKVIQLSEEARRLTVEERADLIELICAMNAEADPEWEVAWEEEIARRLDSVDKGRAHLVPYNDVMAELRSR